MNIYDESTHVLLEPAAVAVLVAEGKGVTYEGVIQIGVTPAVPERLEHIPGTETPENPKGSDRILPAVPEQPIWEDCVFYHAFTPEELAPTWQESMEAQVLYTALLTDTLLEE